MFHTLSEALTNTLSTHIVIAEDVSNAGQKCFRVDSITNLHQIYLNIKDPHWYECLVENKPSRIFLDIESTSQVDLNFILAALRQAIEHKFKVKPQLQILDSCSPVKFSWHIICTNVFLKNVYHVGAFVRRFWLATEIKAIDTAVYTKNRMFRINGSSKFGSERVLKNERPWYELLVQSFDVDTFECLEIDEREPVSCSTHPSQLFYFDGEVWYRKRCETVRHTQTQCSLLNPIIEHINKLCGYNVYRHKISMTAQGYMMVSTKSRVCAIAGRQHRGNNIWFGIDCVRQKVYQKCHDEDCKGKQHEIEVPESLWSKWNHQWSSYLSTQNNENTLYNIPD